MLELSPEWISMLELSLAIHMLTDTDTHAVAKGNKDPTYFVF